MVLIGTHVIQNLEELSALACELVGELQGGDVVLLSGELGAGKTTFTQFLGKQLGVQDHITSPTFTLVGEYGISNNSTISTLIHIDLYRTGEQTALNNNYIQEILDSATQSKSVVVIEWGELFAQGIKNRIWRISLTPGTTESERIVTVEHPLTNSV